MKSILVIDDEKEICESINMILEYENYHVEYETDALKGITKLEFSNYDALLLDIQMPGMNGFEVLKWLGENDIEISVIMISAHNSIENAIKATKLGAFDFIEKPIDRDKLLISIRNAVGQTNLKRENVKLKENLSKKDAIIGESSAIKSILQNAERVAKTEARVLITGENGTGKELIARAIHKHSNRVDKELVEVNCAAIPNELIESELFGHEKGSFTGATNRRIGKFEQANGSTLFLDEIGDMSLQAQAKVLRAIEDGKIERVGGSEKISVDVRIISATNKDLKEEIKNGNFREDLYHRLNVIPIHVPALRDRVEDIPILINYFIDDICRKNGFPSKNVSQQAVEYLMNLEWTGNVRELRNLIERIVIMVPETEINISDVKKLIPFSESKFDDLLDISNSFQEFKEKSEKAFIEKQLEANSWNISKTAETLGIQRSHLYSKMKKYEIEKGSE
ncbi:MAG: sigma-54 dependent transcriptional regulator [Melioribacteraceae bacterium]|nr:sigma-54 dependent transcriptional regulator [Melioribacteraceae bacterium]MCF8352815.1 sigma-54 dependent transcriptional regulator [Melioribacteraceae bacterium]MCF8393465.1 sigma-54 dependent transcriptional regulator [Melioribacteraceae bacterium]MCF8417332.1 sigma-54 dependent transcriptional regulator [Melioribacteraceae bacterium]